MLSKEEAATLRAAMTYMQGVGVRIDGYTQSEVDVALAAIDREEEEDDQLPQTDGMILSPIISPEGQLVNIRGEFRDCPGLFWMMTAQTAEELRCGLAFLLRVKDWNAYRERYGWVGSEKRSA